VFAFLIVVGRAATAAPRAIAAIIVIATNTTTQNIEATEVAKFFLLINILGSLL